MLWLKKQDVSSKFVTSLRKKTIGKSDYLHYLRVSDYSINSSRLIWILLRYIEKSPHFLPVWLLNWIEKFKRYSAYFMNFQASTKVTCNIFNQQDWSNTPLCFRVVTTPGTEHLFTFDRWRSSRGSRYDRMSEHAHEEQRGRTAANVWKRGRPVAEVCARSVFRPSKAENVFSFINIMPKVVYSFVCFIFAATAAVFVVVVVVCWACCNILSVSVRFRYKLNMRGCLVICGGWFRVYVLNA